MTKVAIAELAKQLKPFLVDTITSTSSSSAPGLGAPSPHSLFGVHHTGQLDESQASWAMSRITAGTVTAVHTFNPAAAGEPFHLGANATGQLVAGLHAEQVSRSVIAGAGLTGGGLLTADRTLTVGAGLGITVNADDVALTTPGTLSVSSVNSSTGSHTHAITSSSNPGGAASLLATNVSGILSLVQLAADTVSDRLGSLTITSSSAITINAGTNVTISPTGDILLDPAGNDILPVTGYDLNIGMLTKKFLTLHAAELWVETLVAQNTIATIGGRILVGPTTILTEDISGSSLYSSFNPSFETAGAGGADVFATWVESAGDGAILRDNTTAISGTYSCKLTAGASVNTYVYNPQTVFEAGQRYYVYFYSRGDGTNAGRYFVYDNTAGSTITGTTSTGNATTSWASKIISFTIPASPAGLHNVSIALECPAVNGGIAWFDFLIVVPATISSKYNNLAVGDVVYLEAAGNLEFMSVQAGPTGTGPYLYNMDRNLDGTGPNTWYAGDAIFNTGAAGDGFIDLYSVSGVYAGSQIGPTIVGNVRNSATFNDWSEAWAIGNLNGLYGYGVTTYGVGLGKYTTTTSYMTIDPDASRGIRMFSNNAQRVSITAGALWIGASATTERLTFDTTNGLQIYNHSNASVIKFDTAGNANITGRLRMPDTTSSIAIGSSPPASATSGTGIWIDRTGIYGLLSNTYQVKIDATTGALLAAGGNFTVNDAGLRFKAHATVGSSTDTDIYWYKTDGTSDLALLEVGYTTAPSEGFLSLTVGYTVGFSELLLGANDNLGNGAAVRIDANSSISVAQIRFDVRNNTSALVLYENIFEINVTTVKKNATEVGLFVPLTTPLTSTSWDGDQRSTTSKTVIDLSAVFGVPAGVKAVLASISISDSGAASTDCWVLLSPNNTANQGVGADCNPVANRATRSTHVVPCDSNGDIYYQINASASLSFSMYLVIWGYWI